MSDSTSQRKPRTRLARSSFAGCSRTCWRTASRSPCTVRRRILPFYALLVAKNGPKLAAGKADGKSVLEPKGMGLAAHDTSLSEVADLLTQIATRLNLPPVVDMTGLKGRFDFTVDGTDLLQSIGAGNTPDPSTIMVGVREILQEQLGLKAELRKAPDRCSDRRSGRETSYGELRRPYSRLMFTTWK